MQAIILAGGLGTRLQGVIGKYPKCMAMVNGKPFLYYLFQYLSAQGCTEVILSLGFMHHVVEEWLATQSFNLPYCVAIEDTPLGTGGGIQLAMQQATAQNVVVLNGDTFFDVDLAALIQFHTSQNSATTLALKTMQHFSRYGVVHTNETGIITTFEEKAYKETGRINGGIYVINREMFLSKKLPQQFSFEKDYLEQFVAQHQFYGYESNSYFIDIGIPEDYARVQNDFKNMFL